jgi:hypothetical protein
MPRHHFLAFYNHLGYILTRNNPCHGENNGNQTLQPARKAEKASQ